MERSGEQEKHPLMDTGKQEKHPLMETGEQEKHPLMNTEEQEKHPPMHIEEQNCDAPEKVRERKGSRDATAPDPELVDTATKFVEEIIEKAKLEAAKKIKSEKSVSILT